jgi:hypothetical protein
MALPLWHIMKCNNTLHHAACCSYFQPAWHSNESRHILACDACILAPLITFLVWIKHGHSKDTITVQCALALKASQRPKRKHKIRCADDTGPE